LCKEHFAFLTMVRLHVRSGLRTRFHHGNSWSRVSRLIWFFSVSLKHYRVRADREPRRPFLVGALLERGYQESYAWIEDAGSFFSLRWQYDRGDRESPELFATRTAREGTIHPSRCMCRRPELLGVCVFFPDALRICASFFSSCTQRKLTEDLQI